MKMCRSREGGNDRFIVSVRPTVYAEFFERLSIYRSCLHDFVLGLDEVERVLRHANARSCRRWHTCKPVRYRFCFTYHLILLNGSEETSRQFAGAQCNAKRVVGEFLFAQGFWQRLNRRSCRVVGALRMVRRFVLWVPERQYCITKKLNNAAVMFFDYRDDVILVRAEYIRQLGWFESSGKDRTWPTAPTPIP